MYTIRVHGIFPPAFAVYLITTLLDTHAKLRLDFLEEFCEACGGVNLRLQYCITICL
jgi:hypothetical protein